MKIFSIPFTLMQLMLVLVIAMIIFTVWSAHTDPSNKFNAYDLITENDRVSKFAFGYMIVLTISTWVVLNQEVSGKLSEGTFGLYLATWVGPLIARMVNKNDAPSTVSTTNVSVTETVKSNV